MAPADFHHPYEPYPIQEQFMTAVYDCIEEGKIGIFESPTGTGKSLSLICGSLTWLRKHKDERLDSSGAENVDDDDEPAWMIEHAKKERRRRALQDRQDLNDRLATIRAREAKAKKRFDSGEPVTKRRKTTQPLNPHDEDEEHFVLDDYDSADEAVARSANRAHADSGFSKETQAILDRLGMFTGARSEDDPGDAPDELKIFYCSRTHSQLSQFANELRRVRMPPLLDGEPPDPGGDSIRIVEEIKQLTLGSRKNLCINPKVNRLASATAINERCIELQQSKTSSEHKCEFMPNKENQALVNDFRDNALAKIRDIEDLGEVGKSIGICPYYASRPAIRPSEIVTLPYPLLLQRSAREALELSLKDHVIIIDEAHNLMEAIASMYSASISLAQLELGRAQLMMYLQKFRSRLKGKNRVYVAQIVRVLDSLIMYLRQRQGDMKKQDSNVSIEDLMAGKGIDQINMFKLSKYIQESRLARKVDGYIVFAETEASKTDSQKREREPSTPVLTQIQSFLVVLMNPSKEGRVLCSRTEDGNGISLQYRLSDPTHHFREIVEEARAVILAGGTMSPMDDYIKHLFAYLPPNRILTLSCDHVIPPTNLQAWAVESDGLGNTFDFTFQNRQATGAIVSAGRTLLELIQQIPDGVVAFFASYAYLNTCVKTWREATHGSKTLWAQLQDRKLIFLEPRSDSASREKPSKSNAANTDALLQSYSATIHAHPSPGPGALLMSVINGSLSEGINFSDRLGRAVIVFGLPFPNPHSTEWKAKMEYIASKESTVVEGKKAAQEFYENATMRAVNQAVGRAIRHKGDYASIYLMDKRYGGERISGKLPGWIKGSLRRGAGMREVLEGTRNFFDGKKDM